MPKPKTGEEKSEYVSRFMDDEAMKEKYPDEKQRAAVAYSEWDQKASKSIERDVYINKALIEQMTKLKKAD